MKSRAMESKLAYTRMHISPSAGIRREIADMRDNCGQRPSRFGERGVLRGNVREFGSGLRDLRKELPSRSWWKHGRVALSYVMVCCSDGCQRVCQFAGFLSYCYPIVVHHKTGASC